MRDAIPVNRIKGVGEKTAALFGRINVFTVEDLIGHYPRDYETYDAPVSIREVSAGSVQAIYGQITAIPNVKKVRNLSILNAVLTDDNGDSIQLTFFNMPFLKKVLKPGGFYLFRGLVQQRGTHKIMEQPRMFTWEEYQKKSGRLLPRYALTKGLTNQTVQKSVAQALEYYPRKRISAAVRIAKNTHAFPQGSCQFTALPGKPGGTAGSKEPYRIRRILFFFTGSSEK